MKRITAAAFLTTACLAGVSALPATAQDISTKDIYACAAEADDAARLACYDDAAGRLKAAEDAGEITTVSRTEVENVQRDTFGFSIPSLPKLALPKMGGGSDKVDDNGQLKEVTFAVAKADRNPYKKARITLENGQVWVQSDSNSVRISKKSGVKEATIKRAAMGSFKMKLDGGPAFRVKREK